MKQFTKLVIQLLCKLNIHNWKYYNLLKPITGHKRIKELDIPLRECKHCNIKQHHLMPMCNGSRYNWKPYKFKDDDKLNIVKANV